MDGLTASYFSFLGFLAIMSVCYWVDRWQARRRARQYELQTRLETHVARPEGWWCLGRCESFQEEGYRPEDGVCWRCRGAQERIAS